MVNLGFEIVREHINLKWISLNNTVFSLILMSTQVANSF